MRAIFASVLTLWLIIIITELDILLELKIISGYTLGEMGEIKREILHERFFTPVFGEEGFLPVAPPDALREYARLKEEWMGSYPEVPGVYPGVCLHPIKKDGMTRYVLAQEIWTIQRS